MTKEEEQAIEQLRSWREYIVKNKEKVNKANDIEFYLRTVLNLIQTQQAEIEKKDKKINLLFDERNYIINNLETDLNRKGIYPQAKGQISQILEYYKNNDKYFKKKVEENNVKYRRNRTIYTRK